MRAFKEWGESFFEELKQEWKQTKIKKETYDNEEVVYLLEDK